MKRSLTNHPPHQLSENQIEMLQVSSYNMGHEQSGVRPNDDEDKSSSLSKAQKRELDRRYDDYLNGIGRMYTWEETVEMARQALAKTKSKL